MEDAPGPSGFSDESEIRVHPLVAKLFEAIEGEEGVVELRGLIGPARESDDAIPLYTSPELTECFLVPQDAIVHLREPEPEQANDQPTTIYVKRSTELRLISRPVTTTRADEASPTSSASRPIEGVGTSVPAWTGVSPAAECGSSLSWCLAAAGSDFHRQIECISQYVKSMEIARVD